MSINKDIMFDIKSSFQSCGQPGTCILGKMQAL